jgi:UDP-GlcNAc3NAcA epimerase
MKKIISIIGARPQFIKHAPMQLQLQKHFNALTIHTGQHYDSNMSDVFFNELAIPQPDFLLNIGAAKMQGEQTAQMMIEIEKIFVAENPSAVIVYGDTNSTLAGTLIASKMNIPIIHIEAGLRSYNRNMPEEVNRIIADEFATLLFCPTTIAIENLKKEGIEHDKVFLCGDVMCDMIHLIKDKIKPIVPFEYYFATIHRPYNTDDIERLKLILQTFDKLDKKVIFSIHPRTVARMESNNIMKEDYSNIQFIAPTGYLDSISYQNYSNCVLTDSGGIQKEAYILKKKCITLRSETEWTETIEGGWNTLVFEDLEKIKIELLSVPQKHNSTLYGNGNAAKEITEIIKSNIN